MELKDKLVTNQSLKDLKNYGDTVYTTKTESKKTNDELEARLNNLASLKEGSTTGDAELIDIRVSVEGTTYTSAGEAVRTQIKEIKNDVVKTLAEVEGKEIEIKDAANKPVRKMVAYGESTQTDTPSIDNPVQIVNTEGLSFVLKSGSGEEQSISFSQTLRGIQVRGNGNYTDESGQQWICDTVEIGSNGETKIVRRCSEIVLNGTESWKLQSINSYDIANFTIPFKSIRTGISDALCDKLPKQISAIAPTKTEGFFLNGTNLFLRIKADRIDTVEKLVQYLGNNPIHVVYAVADEPVSETLSPVVLTMYPHTIIENDKKIDMCVTYVIDIKMYVDNKFDEIKTAIAALGTV